MKSGIAFCFLIWASQVQALDRKAMLETLGLYRPDSKRTAAYSLYAAARYFDREPQLAEFVKTLDDNDDRVQDRLRALLESFGINGQITESTPEGLLSFPAAILFMRVGGDPRLHYTFCFPNPKKAGEVVLCNPMFRPAPFPIPAAELSKHWSGPCLKLAPIK